MENSTETKKQSQPQQPAGATQSTASQQANGAQRPSASQLHPSSQTVTLVQSQPQAPRQPQQSNVVEIDLVSLMIYCLKHWRAVLITMLVCGILFGGVKGGQALSSAQDTSATEDTLETYQQALDDYKNQSDTLNREIDSLNLKIAQINTYMEKSVLYNMDKNDVYRGSLLYYIDTGYEVDPNLTYQTPDKTNSVLKAYASLVQNDAFYSEIKKDLKENIDSKYLRELVNVSIDYDSHIMTISVVGSSQTLAHQLLELIQKNMREAKNTVSTMITPHEISLVSSSEYKTVDQNSSVTEDGAALNPEVINVADKQQNIEDTLSSYQTSLTEKTQALKDLTEPEQPTVGKTGAAKTAAKYGAIGLILGLVLAGGVLCVQYVLVDRILDRGRLTSRLPKQTPVYAVVPSGAYGTTPSTSTGSVSGVVSGSTSGTVQSYLPFNAGQVIILGEYFQAPGHNIFDRWAAACDGRKTGEEDLDNVLSVAKANMLNQGAPGRLLIAGMGNTEAVKAFADTAKDAAESITVQENILTDPVGIKALQNIDTAVLIADKKKARLSNTLAEVTQLQRLGKRVAGIVLV